MAFDTREFRSCLGSFTTGVTVVTSKDLDGGYVGVTANSFNSVSMDPPLVLWSLGKSARSLPAFETAKYFAINILASDQMDISNHFATQQEDKFGSIQFQNGIDDLPLLAGCAATIQCETSMVYEGGDHIIIVGKVIEFNEFNKPGLAFSKGKYALSQPHPGLESQPCSTDETVFVQNYMHYLLLMAAQQFENSMIPIINKAGINSHYEWRVLAMLNDSDGLSTDDLADNAPAKYAFMVDVLSGMVDNGLVQTVKKDGVDYYGLTIDGKQKANELLALARAHEEAILENVSLDGDQLKASLKEIVLSLKNEAA